MLKNVQLLLSGEVLISAIRVHVQRHARVPLRLYVLITRNDSLNSGTPCLKCNSMGVGGFKVLCGWKWQQSRAHKISKLET
ncbi:hypothetical protein PHYPO_G00058770 [Pangasianodon hypophthalmus]|uniref:Uncharacterized protein n=1 Tax=Pangasianodon hypophthalmus TaxID=310915 RepID=A0A5N5M3B0_PANHP|nr:hypothetical protein PHYPO_G00058770 [Pangasianodon hypophthalmus]